MPTDREIEDAYAFALAHATGATKRHSCRGGELADAATDAATDAVLWAIKNHNPSLGEFGPFARAAIRSIVQRHVSRTLRKLTLRPTLHSLPEFDTDESPHAEIGDALLAKPVGGVGEIALPLAVRELEPDLRDAVRLFYVDRFTIRECGLLMGIPPETVRQRLIEAGRRLGGSAAGPRRATGEKRVVR